MGVGIGQGAIDELIALATEKTPSYTTTTLRNREVAQGNVARAQATIGAARAYLHQAVDAVYRTAQAGGKPSLDQGVDAQLATCTALEAGSQAVNLVHDTVGTSGIRQGLRFEQLLRDVRTISQHAFGSLSRYESCGKVLFGLDSDWGFFYLWLRAPTRPGECRAGDHGYMRSAPTLLLISGPPATGDNSKHGLSGPVRLGRVEDAGEGLGRGAVAAGNGVGVDIEGRRRSRVAQPLGHRVDGDPGGEHLGGHEVTQVVEPEVAEAGLPASGDELLGDPVRQLRLGTIGRCAEHEGVRARGATGRTRPGGAVLDEHGEGVMVDVDPVGAVRLGGPQLHAVGAGDGRSGEGEGAVVEVNVAPTQGEELAATRPRRDGQAEEDEQCGGAL